MEEFATNQGQNQGWNPEETIKAMVSERAAQIEGFADLSEGAKNAFIDHCVKNKIFRFEKCKNLNGFVHYQTEDQVVFSVLVDNLLVYVTESRFIQRLHEDRYYRYLRDNGLTSDELSYEQFIEQTIFSDPMEEQVKYYAHNYKVGCVFTSLLKENRRVQERLQFVNSSLQALKDALGDTVNFIQESE